MDGELRFEGCEVEAQLRAGPVTNWYRARQTAVGRSVVIQALSPQLLPDSPFARPLEREARLLGRLHHEGVVRLHDFQRRGQQMWLVREFVDGTPLDRMLEGDKQLPLPVAVGVARQLAETLQHVHENGIVHQDLRPANVLLGSDGQVKLCDFFSADDRGSAADPELVEGGQDGSRQHYISPERALGERGEPRSDVFCLGLLLYRMVAGHGPFDGEGPRSLTQRIRHAPPAPLRPTAAGAPALLERSLLRALQKVPADRFADAKEFGVALETLQGQLGSGSSHSAVRDFLRGRSPAPMSAPAPQQRATGGRLSGTVLTYVGLLVLLVVGSTAIQYTFGRGGGRRPAAAQETLPLAPQAAGKLRAVVYPWAHVFVDGQKVATTPFASPIPLEPGTHYVKFEHPKAESIRRQIRVFPRQEVFLDIQMDVELPEPTEPPPAAPGSPDGGTPSP